MERSNDMMIHLPRQCSHMSRVTDDANSSSARLEMHGVGETTKCRRTPCSIQPPNFVQSSLAPVPIARRARYELNPVLCRRPGYRSNSGMTDGA
eukprot:5256931-Pyramimonas_sp.AAC.1